MSDSLRIPDSIDLQRLEAMQLVAKMKDSADKHGIGFIGGFVAPDGQKFIMTNLDDNDAEMLLPENLRDWNELEIKTAARIKSIDRAFLYWQCISFWFKLENLFKRKAKRLMRWL